MKTLFLRQTKTFIHGGLLTLISAFVASILVFSKNFQLMPSLWSRYCIPLKTKDELHSKLHLLGGFFYASLSLKRQPKAPCIKYLYLLLNSILFSKFQAANLIYFDLFTFWLDHLGIFLYLHSSVTLVYTYYVNETFILVHMTFYE